MSLIIYILQDYSGSKILLLLFNCLELSIFGKAQNPSLQIRFSLSLFKVSDNSSLDLFNGSIDINKKSDAIN